MWVCDYVFRTIKSTINYMLLPTLLLLLLLLLLTLLLLPIDALA